MSATPSPHRSHNPNFVREIPVVLYCQHINIVHVSDTDKDVVDNLLKKIATMRCIDCMLRRDISRKSPQIIQA